MRYTWDDGCAFEMAAIPKAAAGQIKLAGLYHLRVLIWLCCVGQGNFDAKACSEACGASPEMCEESLEYWQAQGLIRVAEDQPTVKCEPTVAQAMPTVPSTVTAAPVKTVADKPTYPSRLEVLDAYEQDEAFAVLLQTASAKLGKTLSNADMSVYLYLYRDLKLPPEVILMIVGYAVKNKKAKLTYIEKTALGWVEDGITTIAAADEYLCAIERREQAWTQLREWIDGLSERPTVKQKETAVRWLCEWAFTKEMLEPVVAYTVETLGAFQMPYCDRILERLYTEGVKTPDDVKEKLTTATAKPAKKRTGRMKTASDRAPSYDLDQYEELAMRHRPQMPAQEG